MTDDKDGEVSNAIIMLVITVGWFDWAVVKGEHVLEFIFESYWEKLWHISSDHEIYKRTPVTFSFFHKVIPSILLQKEITIIRKTT